LRKETHPPAPDHGTRKGPGHRLHGTGEPPDSRWRRGCSPTTPPNAAEFKGRAPLFRDTLSARSGEFITQM